MGKNPIPPDDINQYGKVEPIKPHSPEQTPVNEEAFQSYMEEPSSTQAEETEKMSPMNLNQTGLQQASPTVDSILAQMNTTHQTIDKLNNYLNTPNLSLKPTYSKLIDGKLTDALNHIDSASKAIGLTPNQRTEIKPGTTPVMKFLTYMTDGQKQIEQTQQKLTELAQSKEPLNPAKLMMIQVKLAQAQQEIEYSSILLSQVVNMLKQVMNIQI
ncbi:MAG TPA: hypothetical protein P5048_00030 [Chlamydiales bacterium]|nr:hypothetical protein [Chlamydiales bacterium]